MVDTTRPVADRLVQQLGELRRVVVVLLAGHRFDETVVLELGRWRRRVVIDLDLFHLRDERRHFKLNVLELHAADARRRANKRLVDELAVDTDRLHHLRARVRRETRNADLRENLLDALLNANLVALSAPSTVTSACLPDDERLHLGVLAPQPRGASVPCAAAQRCSRTSGGSRSDASTMPVPFRR